MLAALFDLLRGFQAAGEQRKGKLLHQVLADSPDDVDAQCRRPASSHQRRSMAQSWLMVTQRRATPTPHSRNE